MSKILLSIHPEYVEKIIDRSKKYEFRKRRCKQEIKKIIIYETAPVCMVIGEVEVVEVMEGTPEKIWEMTEEFSGIKKNLFESYYENQDNAVAFHLGTVKKYRKPKSIEEFGVKVAPQSYVYVK